MIRSLSVLFLLLLSGCGVLQGLQHRNDLDKIQSTVSGYVVQATGILAQADQKLKEAEQAADVNGDGKVEGGYENLLLLLLGGGGLGSLLEIGRRKFKALEGKHAESAEHRSELEARIDWEREKRKDAEVAGLRALLDEKNRGPGA